MTEYVVVRRWRSRHGKREFQIVVGPYPSRYRATRTIDAYINEWGYWNTRDQFSVAIYRRPEHVVELGEVV